MIQEANELLTAVQLAGRLNVRPRTVQKWSRKGRIPCVRISYKVIRYEWQKVFEVLRSSEIRRISQQA